MGSKFDALDTDGSGLLTAADLEKIVAMEIEKRNRKKKGEKIETTDRTPVQTPTKPVAEPVVNTADDTTNEVACPEGEGGAAGAILSTPFRPLPSEVMVTPAR